MSGTSLVGEIGTAEGRRSPAAVDPWDADGRQVLTVIPSGEHPGALIGNTDADARLLAEVMSGPGDFNDLVRRCYWARVRLVILTDLEPLL